MELYQDYSVVVELQEDTNILCVQWLEQHAFSYADFEMAFMTVIKFIEKYGIKKLVHRTTKTMIHLPDEEYLSIIALLQSGLAHSRIEKVARIYVDKSPRDLECIAHFEHMMNEMQLEIQFQNFENRRSALAWLMED